MEEQKGDDILGVYVGISDRTGELVVGDMLIEFTVLKNETKQSIAILDYDDNHIHPVPACIKILPDLPM